MRRVNFWPISGHFWPFFGQKWPEIIFLLLLSVAHQITSLLGVEFKFAIYFGVKEASLTMHSETKVLIFVQRLQKPNFWCECGYEVIRA